jgi:pullulanase/glycogen debranching enzyme
VKQDGWGRRRHWRSRNFCRLLGRDAHKSFRKNSDSPHIYLIANAYWETLSFQLPNLNNQKWHRFIDTSLPGELAIMDDENLQVLGDQDHYLIGARTVVVLIGR